MRKAYFALLVLPFVLTLVNSQTANDHDKVVACYHESWAYYR